ncbi:MAG: 16S rRNA (adenine(1518)-N(6)/adenine(1519)-N(6))-dimethyltransferase RsmA [Acidobacteriota bacterium]
MSKPKKKWGQNFLRNAGAVDRIVAAVEPQPDELILEIGPGEGVLTEKLVAMGNELSAIEIDPELAETLRAKFGDIIVEADALETPLPTRPFRAVGNLPYNVGTPILRRIVADPNFRRGVFMLQKEVADRLVAKAGDEAYGYLTLYVQLFAAARTLMTLEPGSFHPPPKVRSAVVVLDPAPKAFASDDLIALISRSFGMRRKQLVNNLVGFRGIGRAYALEAMTAAGINENARAETMTLDDFHRLATFLVLPSHSASHKRVHDEEPAR